MQEKDENITKIIERLLQYVKYKKISLSKIAINISLSNSYFSKMLKSNGSLGEDVTRKILLYYDDISPTWLMLGQGSMLKSEVSNNQLDNNIDKLLNIIKDKDIQISQLNRELGGLESENKLLKKQIAQCSPDAGCVAATG